MRFDRTSIRVWSSVFLIYILGNSEALFKFKNIKCTCYEKSFCLAKKCELKILGRGIIGLNIHFQANQLPINTAKCVLTLYRWFNGYRPFLYNVSVDVCSFLKHKKRYPFFNLVYEGIQNFSNVNHSCPYNHDVIVDRMVLNDKMISKVPVPSGRYMLIFHVQTDGVWRGEVEVHVEVNLGFERR